MDRGFIRDQFHLFDVEDQFFKELNIGQDKDKHKKVQKGTQRKRFQMYLRHLYKSAAPLPEHL